MDVIVAAGKFFEGENYPSSSSIIPYLDLISEDLQHLSTRLSDQESKSFVKNVRDCLFNIFPDGMKNRTPYNCLTLLDLRHMDLYFSGDQTTKSKTDILEDVVYEAESNDDDLIVDTSAGVETVATETQSGSLVTSLERRRAQLLAKKRPSNTVATGSIAETFNTKIGRELDRFLVLSGTVDINMNPMDWWRNHALEFPLLARYWRAYSSFPTTSASSERVFNVDGLVLTSSR